MQSENSVSLGTMAMTERFSLSIKALLSQCAHDLPCPLTFYRRATGQSPSCKNIFQKGQTTLLEIERHLDGFHAEDMAVCLRLLEDLLQLAPQGPCPFCEESIKRDSQSDHQSAFLSHLLSTHLVEVQVMAALSDTLALVAYSKNCCPYETLGPCPQATSPPPSSPHHPKPSEDQVVKREASPSPATSSSFLTASLISPKKRVPSAHPSSPLKATSTVGNDPITVLPMGAAVKEVDWWSHVRSIHLQDTLASVKSVLSRCQQQSLDQTSPSKGHESSTPVKISCCLPDCSCSYTSVIDLTSHLISHLRPRHQSHHANRSQGESTISSAVAASVLLVKHKGEEPSVKAKGGTKPLLRCTLCEATLLSDHNFSNHVSIAHHDQIDALCSGLSLLARKHQQTGWVACPFRTLGGDPHGHMCEGLADLRAHMVSYHLPQLAAQCGFAKGLASLGKNGHCLVCQGEDVGRRVDSALITGPTSLLQHLSTSHPLQLMKLIHCAEAFVDLDACLPGCNLKPSSGRTEKLLHIAEQHAVEVLDLSDMAAGAAPLPMSMEWTKQIKIIGGLKDGKKLEQQDKAVQVSESRLR